MCDRTQLLHTAAALVARMALIHTQHTMERSTDVVVTHHSPHRVMACPLLHFHEVLPAVTLLRCLSALSLTHQDLSALVLSIRQHQTLV